MAKQRVVQTIDYPIISVPAYLRRSRNLLIFGVRTPVTNEVRKLGQELIYQKRKAAGLCLYGRCVDQADRPNWQCQKHLKRMT